MDLLEFLRDVPENASLKIETIHGGTRLIRCCSTKEMCALPTDDYEIALRDAGEGGE